MHTLFVVHRNDEEKYPRRHGNYRVRQGFQRRRPTDFPASQQGAKAPGERRRQEHPQHDPFPARKAPEFGEFLLNPLTSAGNGCGHVSEQYFHEQQVRDDGHHGNHRHRNLEPSKKVHLFVIGLFHKAHENAVGRRADERQNPAQTCAVSDRKQNAHVKVMFTPPIVRRPFLLADHLHDGNRNGEHHRRRRRVAYPRREKARREHDAQNNLLRFRADRADREQRNSLVKPPTCDPRRNEKSPEEEINRTVGVVFQSFRRRRYAEQWK